MSRYSNPSDSTPDEIDSYISALLDMIGDQEPLDVLAVFIDEIRKITDGLTAEQLRTPEAPGKWSAIELLSHLADGEMIWAVRIRMTAAHDRPELPGYDQDLWAKRLGYKDAALADVLAVLAPLRAANLRLIASLTPADLRRVAIHAERGDESIEHMIRLYAGHDLVHRWQLERIRKRLFG